MRYLDATDLKVRDEDGYNAALASSGLLADWVSFGDYSIHRTNNNDRPATSWTLSFTGWPNKNESMVVTNPKDIVTKGLPNIPTLRSEMASTMLEILGGTWAGGDPSDGALAYAPAVFMLQQAVDSMAQAKELGAQEEKTEEEEERKRKENLILLIIGVVLMVSANFPSLRLRIASFYSSNIQSLQQVLSLQDLGPWHFTKGISKLTCYNSLSLSLVRKLPLALVLQISPVSLPSPANWVTPL